MAAGNIIMVPLCVPWKQGASYCSFTQR